MIVGSRASLVESMSTGSGKAPALAGIARASVAPAAAAAAPAPAVSRARRVRGAPASVVMGGLLITVGISSQSRPRVKARAPGWRGAHPAAGERGRRGRARPADGARPRPMVGRRSGLGRGPDGSFGADPGLIPCRDDSRPRRAHRDGREGTRGPRGQWPAASLRPAPGRGRAGAGRDRRAHGHLGPRGAVGAGAGLGAAGGRGRDAQPRPAGARRADRSHRGRRGESAPSAPTPLPCRPRATAFRSWWAWRSCRPRSVAISWSS